MKQIIQNYRSGVLELKEVPRPICPSDGLLIKTHRSLVSVGTEKLMIGVAKKNLLGKAKARPDLVKRVLDKLKAEGLAETAKQVFARLDTPTALGYSSAGEVIEIGALVKGFKKGDRVAVAGSDIASHAEFITARQSDVVKLPATVSYDQAAFGAVAGIALEAIYAIDKTTTLATLQKLQLKNKRVAVIGLGLLGNIAVQILKSHGAFVYGIDIDPSRLEQLSQRGPLGALGLDEYGSASASHPHDSFDATLIFASTPSNQPLETAAAITKHKGTVVAAGFIGLSVPREPFYNKELRLVVPHSWGWSAQDTLPEVIELIAGKKLHIEPLITHRFSIIDAPRAYEQLLAGNVHMIGVLFEYDETGHRSKHAELNKTLVSTSASSEDRRERLVKMTRPIGVGLIGAGLFAKGTLLPLLKKDVRLNLRGVATARGSSAQHTAESFGFSYATTDYTKLLQDKSIDVVVIATRHNLHARLIGEALEAGKHVFCEKPLAMNEEELQKLEPIAVKYVIKGKQKLMVGFNRRYAPLSQQAKAFIGSQTPMMILMRVNIGHMDSSSWVYSNEGGGNVIGELGHFIDLANYFAGSPIAKTSVSTIPSHSDSMKTNDNLSATLLHKNGALTTIVYATLGSRSYDRELIEIYAGSNVAAIHNFTSLTLASEKGKRVIKRMGIDRGHANEIKTFFDALEGGTSLPVSFEEYTHVSRITFEISHVYNRGV